MQPEKAIVALDLDGTLLDSDKNLSERNRAALAAAAARGAHDVPTTGRFFGAMPRQVRELPFVRYAITINGAQIWDAANGRSVAQALVPLEEALAVFDVLARFDVLPECYVDNWGLNSEASAAAAAEYAPDAHYLDMILNLRRHVPDVAAHLRATGLGVQKILAFAKDPALFPEVAAAVKSVAPDLVATTSHPRLFEFNAPGAHKGEALRKFCAAVGRDVENAIALGDGMNDLSMIRAAGVGVAMANSAPEVLAAADWVAPSNDDDGVAAAVERFLLGGQGREEERSSAQPSPPSSPSEP
ncbi:MAG: Cof-type HAD-IIB family hydrolase [Kiritimatiellae bacterium]|nr:Cof-type HAD-IIB family hydrolase [Kiritimatiellia bacterium]